MNWRNNLLRFFDCLVILLLTLLLSVLVIVKAEPHR